MTGRPDARAEILARLRAVRPGPAIGAPGDPPRPVPRRYATGPATPESTTPGPLAPGPTAPEPTTPGPTAPEPTTPGSELLDLLTDRLIDYRATVLRCDPDGLPATLGTLLAEVTAVAVPPGAPAGWLSAYSGRVLRDGSPRPLTVADLDVPGLAVLTGCAVAVASTGTLLLDAGADQGRRQLTLVPDHHICVVYADQVVAGVPEALSRLADPTRPLTLVSGPSATSDIELNRVEGVHGPRRLAVLLVG